MRLEARDRSWLTGLAHDINSLHPNMISAWQQPVSDDDFTCPTLTVTGFDFNSSSKVIMNLGYIAATMKNSIQCDVSRMTKVKVFSDLMPERIEGGD